MNGAEKLNLLIELIGEIAATQKDNYLTARDIHAQLCFRYPAQSRAFKSSAEVAQILRRTNIRAKRAYDTSPLLYECAPDIARGDII